MASDEGKLEAEVGDLWDSGWRESGRQSGVLCRGKAFADGATVWWKVRVREAGGEPGPWSEASRIEVPRAAAEVKRVSRPGAAEGGKVEFVEGRSGQAIRLGANGPTVWSEDYRELRSGSGTTIMAWIKPDKVGDGWQCIFRKEDGNDRPAAPCDREGRGILGSVVRIRDRGTLCRVRGTI